MNTSLDRSQDEAQGNVSVSSASSNDSQGFTECKTASKSSLFKQSSKARLERKREKKWKKNKIGKEDFYNKTAEFRTWLREKKHVELDKLSTPKAKSVFKKFIKKWNGKKLDPKYYDGLGVYWAAASPGAYSHHPSIGGTTPPNTARNRPQATTFTPLYEQDFSTFGKRTGQRVLQELKQQGLGSPTPSASSHEEHVYDEPTSIISEKSSWQDSLQRNHWQHSTRSRCSRSIKPRPTLAQLFGSSKDLQPPCLDNDEEPAFAKVTRQRPLSCYGRVQLPLKPPSPPSVDNFTDPFMRAHPGRLPRPHTEYHCVPKPPKIPERSRKESQSTISTCSDDSDTCSLSSKISSSSCSTVASSVSSIPPGKDQQIGDHHDNDHQYVAFRPAATHKAQVSKADYVTPQPAPPPRTSSIGSHTQDLRKAAGAVLARQKAITESRSPATMSTPHHPPSGIDWVTTGVETPPMPSPPPPLTPTAGNMMDDILSPPPGFEGDNTLNALSPALPPPPSPLAMEGAVPSTTPSISKVPSGSTSGTDRLDYQLALPQPTVTRQHAQTPAHLPVSGPSLQDPEMGPASSVSTKKRLSTEKQEPGVTSAKKLNLDVSYRSTFV